MKVNLTLLLSNDADIETLPDLPSEDDMVNAFHLQETEKDTEQSTSQRESDNDVDVVVNELCIVIWDDKPGQRNWYVRMCRSKDEETYEIEHMERVRAIPWWRLWPKFENFSLLIDHSSYNKQAINHFMVDVRSTLGGQSTATPPKN